jgi:hypothetical protein
MLPVAVLAHTKRCVFVALPADDEIEAIVIYAHDDLLDQHTHDQHAHDPLARGDAQQQWKESTTIGSAASRPPRGTVCERCRLTRISQSTRCIGAANQR